MRVMERASNRHGQSHHPLCKTPPSIPTLRSNPKLAIPPTTPLTVLRLFRAHQVPSPSRRQPVRAARKPFRTYGLTANGQADVVPVTRAFSMYGLPAASEEPRSPRCAPLSFPLTSDHLTPLFLSQNYPIHHRRCSAVLPVVRCLFPCLQHKIYSFFCHTHPKRLLKPNRNGIIMSRLHYSCCVTPSVFKDRTYSL